VEKNYLPSKNYLLIIFKNKYAIQAPARAVANCGQLIIIIIGFEIPCKTEFAKIIPTDQIKINFKNAANIEAVQKLLALSRVEGSLNLKNTKTKIIFPIIINGITGAKANGKRPVKSEIKLGTRHKTIADSTPIIITEIKSRAFTIDPVIN